MQYNVSDKRLDVDAALAKQYEQEKTETKNFEINLSQSHS
jgi:hypothetical protein